jgi:predicted DNA-binding transcriptional regulator
MIPTAITADRKKPMFVAICLLLVAALAIYICEIVRAAAIHLHEKSNATPHPLARRARPASRVRRLQGEDVASVGWYGFMAPAATPDPIVERMQSEIGQALSDTNIKQKLAVQGLDVHYLPGEAFGKFIDSESDKWGKIIR